MSTPFTGLINKPLEQMFLFCLAREETQVYNVIKSMYNYIPHYLRLFQTGELHTRAEEADRLKNCALCPRECGVDRTKDEFGFCGSGYLPIVASYCVHHGEEPVLSGAKGSGTIFLETAI